jgi:hypothetical protein
MVSILFSNNIWFNIDGKILESKELKTGDYNNVIIQHTTDLKNKDGKMRKHTDFKNVFIRVNKYKDKTKVVLTDNKILYFRGNEPFWYKQSESYEYIKHEGTWFQKIWNNKRIFSINFYTDKDNSHRIYLNSLETDYRLDINRYYFLDNEISVCNFEGQNEKIENMRELNTGFTKIFWNPNVFNLYVPKNMRYYFLHIYFLIKQIITRKMYIPTINLKILEMAYGNCKGLL